MSYSCAGCRSGWVEWMRHEWVKWSDCRQMADCKNRDSPISPQRPRRLAQLTSGGRPPIIRWWAERTPYWGLGVWSSHGWGWSVACEAKQINRAKRGRVAAVALFMVPTRAAIPFKILRYSCLYTLVGMFCGTKRNDWRTPLYLPSVRLMIFLLVVMMSLIWLLSVINCY